MQNKLRKNRDLSKTDCNAAAESGKGNGPPTATNQAGTKKRGRPPKQSQSQPAAASVGLSEIFNFDDAYFQEENDNLEILQQTLMDNLCSLLSDENPHAPWLTDLIVFANSNESKLKMVHIKINSIFNKLFELVKLIELGKYDIVTVQETKLGPEIPDNLFSFANYITLRRDRCRGGGGLMVFVKRSVKLVSHHFYTDIEAISFTIESFKKTLHFSLFIILVSIKVFLFSRLLTKFFVLLITTLNYFSSVISIIT